MMIASTCSLAGSSSAGSSTLPLLGGRLQLGRHRALAVDHAGRDEVVVDLLGLLVAQALLDAIIAP